MVGVYKKAVAAAAVVTAIKSGEAGRAEPSSFSFLVPLQNAASDDRPGTADRGGNYGVLYVGGAT